MRNTSIQGNCLAILICLCVGLTITDYGITWDETVYFHAGKQYIGWILSPFSDLEQVWGHNSEHPPLTKTLGGFFIALFHLKLDWLSEHTAYRTSILVFVYILSFCLFTFSKSFLGLWPAVFVVLSFSFLPRIFFHAHIGAQDYAITACWFFAIYALWKNHLGLIILAVIMALLTKIQGLFLCFPILLYYWQQGTLFTRKFVIIAIACPLLFFALWPWLWIHPWDNFYEYALFHADHRRIPLLYFGEIYKNAPWSVPFVITLLTTPVLVLGLGTVGIVAKGLERDWKIFFLFNILLVLTVIAVSPSKHDGVRLFLPIFPFICIFAGAGLKYLYANTVFPKSVFNGLIILVSLITLYTGVIRYHPYQTLHYNEFIGSTENAHNLGLETDYWCSGYIEILQWMNQRPDSIYWTPICGNILQYYKKAGMLNPKIESSDRQPKKADYYILPPKKSFTTPWIKHQLKRAELIFQIKKQGVSILDIYENKLLD